ncbi:Formyltransferase/hydrolase complex Fhc subunit C [bioreactor metagenome]|uniref:Formyltransferase/hydrolase complex Fhc subunit C n=1 Tax=bioreactor metagenome TaxID=1076179 RepID=A0A645EA89_9ZZZZ
MQVVKLFLKKANKIPIEADNVNPDNFAGKTAEEIKATPVWYGNGQCSLGDFFTVEVEGSDSVENTKIVFDGDVSRVKRIGQNMTAGEIEINGNVDMHCGFGMNGGKIVINGNADSWLGCEMSGGEIILNGNASYYVGAGYRGESCGMRGGKITVNGSTKDYLGEHMCGGEILVKGDVGRLPAISNNGGKIVIEGSATMPASEMKNGTVIIKGEVFDLLPSYKEEGMEEVEGISYRKFTGDVNVGGKGILLIK